MMTYNKIRCKLNDELTCVPRLSSRRANGKMPSIMSMPLLSTKMKAHLWGGPFSRCSQSSKSSYSHGRTATPHEMPAILTYIPKWWADIGNNYSESVPKVVTRFQKPVLDPFCDGCNFIFADGSIKFLPVAYCIHHSSNIISLSYLLIRLRL